MTADRSFPYPATPSAHASMDLSSAHMLSLRAHAAYDAGDLPEARLHFDALLASAPDDPAHHAMQAQVCKYLLDWPASLHHGLHALALYTDADAYTDAKHAAIETLRWNAAIAATALSDLAEARRQWAACGIDSPANEGRIDTTFGVASLRLEAWGLGQTVFARRIDPVRAQLIGVPSPATGYRYGDVVLHDSVPTGRRRFHQSMVPVLNALQRMDASAYPAFAVRVRCPQPHDLDALVEARVPGIAFVEDWTADPMRRIPSGAHGPPQHDENGDDRGHDVHGSSAAEDHRRWRTERSVGIAAQSRHSVVRLIDRWRARDHGRRMEELDSRDTTPTAPTARAGPWWLPRENGNTNARESSDNLRLE